MNINLTKLAAVCGGKYPAHLNTIQQVGDILEASGKPMRAGEIAKMIPRDWGVRSTVQGVTQAIEKLRCMGLVERIEEPCEPYEIKVAETWDGQPIMKTIDRVAKFCVV